MDLISTLGLAAACFTTAAFVPQAYKTIKTKSTRGLSAGTYALFFLGTMLWLVYGIYIKDLPIILANSITASLAAIILYLILTIKPKPD
ncbi:hypothetical protein F0P94_13245 [Adhaeribacter soli]|uniref:SemiSWEET transporter n=2 Tax=Adhaeribacter soli TaxID=2607655 RepID=A0A5N1ISR6_9BACT|nr:hypothetical protein F0P94_13245 [Adhaeribacter soli]